jgi:predicted DCC family thiol-disulfide oxidoreductase YuxK
MEAAKKRLFVLYDDKCGLCLELKRWAAMQPAFLELVFLPAGSQEALRLFPGLATPGRPEELIVISDEGGVYRDVRAYIMCLYALMEYREWAMRLSSPTLMPLARQAFQLVSRNRGRLSAWLGTEETRLAAKLQQQPPPLCNIRQEGHCPFCKSPVQQTDSVFCPECSAIHHRECWIANNYRCSIFGCAPEIERLTTYR